MARARPDITVVLVASDRVLRADLDAEGEVRAFRAHAQARSAAGDSLVQSVDRALAEEPRHAARVLVLSEDVWTQTVELARAAIHGISPLELSRALAFEIEPLSGIPADDAAIAHVRIGSAAGEREIVWVSVVRASTRSAVELALRARGATLAGIAHPAGLSHADDAGARIEVWDHATLCDAGALSTKRAQRRVFSARAGLRSWEKSVGEWLAHAGTDAVAWTGRARAADFSFASGSVLADRGLGDFDAQSERWIARAAQHALRGSENAPLIAAAPRVRRPISATLVCLLLTLPTLAFVVWSRSGGTVHAAELETRAQEAETALAQAKAAEASRTELTKSLAQVSQTLATTAGRADAIEREWLAQASRLQSLVSEIALHKPAGLTILGIEPRARGVHAVRGIGIDAASIQRFVADLEPGLRAAHWSVRPALATEQHTREGRAYFEFTIDVEPRAASGSVARAIEPGAASSERRVRRD